MEPRTEPVVLILADISGYTRFMIANQKALVHAQMVITRLLEGIIRQVEIPLVVKEIEGDAVFLYAMKSRDEAEWEDTRRLIGRKLASFFEAFAHGILWGSEFALCSCPSCASVDQLKLKIVVHSGEAVFHEVGGSPELSGPDVILAHRLLKNSVASDEYILMTEPAHKDIEFQTEWHSSRGEENYEGFGLIATYTYMTESSAPRPEAVEQLYANRFEALGTALKILSRGYFGQFPVLLGLRSERRFGDLDEVPVSRMARVAMALGYFVLAPLVLPFGASVQAYRALTRSTRATRARRA